MITILITDTKESSLTSNMPVLDESLYYVEFGYKWMQNPNTVFEKIVNIIFSNFYKKKNIYKKYSLLYITRIIKKHCFICEYEKAI